MRGTRVVLTLHESIFFKHQRKYILVPGVYRMIYRTVTRCKTWWQTDKYTFESSLQTYARRNTYKGKKQAQAPDCFKKRNSTQWWTSSKSTHAFTSIFSLQKPLQQTVGEKWEIKELKSLSAVIYITDHGFTKVKQNPLSRKQQVIS